MLCMLRLRYVSQDSLPLFSFFFTFDTKSVGSSNLHAPFNFFIYFLDYIIQIYVS